MAREFAKWFYGSEAWKSCRESYRQSVAGLCEDCLELGLVTPGDEVHHIIPITPHNINDPSITLNPSNLVLLCHDHHMKRHGRSKRYKVDALGRVEIPLPVAN